MINLKIIIKYKLEILLILITVFIYFLLRLPNLTLQPIFADEAIYIRWAQIMKSEPTLRFVSLSDGKTPLFMWLMTPMFKIFSDPLYAGRLLSVISGVVTLAGVFILAYKLFNIRTAFWAAFIYTITPYTIFFDRMALVDSMLASFTIWAMVFAVLLLKSQRLDLAMILGYFLGGALLVKTPAMINLLALPLTIIGFDFKNNKRINLLKLLGLWMIAFLIALVIYNILRLGPGFMQLSARNADYMFTPLEVINHPLNPFTTNLRFIKEWLPKLITWPILILGSFGIFFAFKKKNSLAISILLWTLTIILLQMFFLKTFTARYILSSIPPLLIFAGFGLENVAARFKKYKLFVIALLLAALSIPLYNSFLLLTNPEEANLPGSERRGYFEDWTAGYGLKEIAIFLEEKSKNGQVVVGTEGSFGTLPDGLQIYLDKNRQVIVIGGTATVSAQLKRSALDQPTYFVANKSRFLKDSPGLKFIKEYPKAINGEGKRDSTMLFEVLKPN